MPTGAEEAACWLPASGLPATGLPRSGCMPGAVSQPDGRDAAAADVGALYEQSAVSLIRLAFVILGDRQSAEDVVQDAFFGLYRHWERLAGTGQLYRYVRASVINGCRSVLRRRSVRSRTVIHEQPSASAESAV